MKPIIDAASWIIVGVCLTVFVYMLCAYVRQTIAHKTHAAYQRGWDDATRARKP